MIMSAETADWLKNNILRGFTDKRGDAWWHTGATRDDGRPNHYADAVPVADVAELLFDWDAEIIPLRAVRAAQAETIDEDGVTPAVSALDIETRFQAVYRPDTGDVFDRAFAGSYSLHQYKERLLRDLATILDDDLKIGSAGLLKRGQIAWVQVESPDTREVAGVHYRPFITAASSMNGMIATQYRRNVQVVECDNTLSSALAEDSEAGVIKFRHTKGSLDKFGDVREALGIIFETGDTFAAEVERLCAVKVSQAKFNRWADIASGIEVAKAKTAADGKATSRGLTGAEKKRGELLTLWQHDERVSPWKGTAYGVVAAWNTWVHHFQGVKGQTRAEANQTRVVRGYVGKEDAAALKILERV